MQEMEHTGNAAATGLASGIAATDVTFTLLSGTNYPTGALGLFVLCLDPGTSSEEKVLCQSRSGTTVNVAPGGRGFDGTSAASHSAGTVNVTHVLSAAELSDYSQHIYLTSRDDHTQYARVDGTRAFTGGVAGTTAAFSGTVATGPLTVASGGATVTGNSTITGNLTVTGTVTEGGDSLLPSGVMMDFAGSSAPSGWLLCDGSAVSRSTYANLFSAISTTWGTGDGSTTFNVPDFRGRVTVGSGTGSGLTARTLAATGGEEAHALVTGELASHAHTDTGHSHTDSGHSHGSTGGTSGNHSHSIGTGTGFAVTGVGTFGPTNGGGPPTVSGPVSNTAGQSADHTHATSSGNAAIATGNASLSNTGSGTAHNTMQPFAVVTKIIKV